MVNLVVQKLKVAGGLEVLTWGQLKLGLVLLDVACRLFSFSTMLPSY